MLGHSGLPEAGVRTLWGEVCSVVSLSAVVSLRQVVAGSLGADEAR